MITKKITAILTTAGFVSILLASPIGVLAQTVTPGTTGNQSAKLATLNSQCQTEVGKRLTSLTSVQSRIGTLKRLSAQQQQQFSGQVSTNMTGLQGVQTQCTTDFTGNNLPALRNDYKSIFTQYRIYAEMLPQLHLLIASDTMGYTANNLQTFYGKLQTRVQSAGNPANMTSLLTDMNAKITDAQSQYTSVESQVSGLTPTSYDTNPTGTTATFQTARTEIKTGATDLQTAYSDAKQLVALLKSQGGATPTGTH